MIARLFVALLFARSAFLPAGASPLPACSQTSRAIRGRLTERSVRTPRSVLLIIADIFEIVKGILTDAFEGGGLILIDR